MKLTEIHKRKISKAQKRRCKENPQLNKGKNNPMYDVHRYGNNAPLWKNGRYKDCDGYIKIYSPNHPYAKDGRYVAEHRLVYEAFLNDVSLEMWKALIENKMWHKEMKFLQLPKEIIHHKNCIRDDNQLNNLLLTSPQEHIYLHAKLNFEKGKEY